MEGFAKSALGLGFAGMVATASIAPAYAQINIDVPGLHVHVGRHRHHYPPPPPGYYAPGYAPGYYRGYNPNLCGEGWSLQDGVCKPYRGY